MVCFKIEPAHMQGRSLDLSKNPTVGLQGVHGPQVKNHWSRLTSHEKAGDVKLTVVNYSHPSCKSGYLVLCATGCFFLIGKLCLQNEVC